MHLLRPVRPVYDTVLLPPDGVARAAIEESERLRALGTRFTLGPNEPHVSLSMRNILEQDLPWAVDRLAEVAARNPAILLRAQRLATNEYGMVEVFYGKPPQITALQEDELNTLDPLRDGLREFDPVGRSISDRMRTATGELARNFERYGYDEIGSYFNPHITLARLIDPNVQPEPPDLAKFDGTFERLALYRMGDHGTCVERIAEWPLRARVSVRDDLSGRTQRSPALRRGHEQRDSPARTPDNPHRSK